MSDQFGSNLNSLEYALTGHNEQEFIENLQIDIPKMEHQPAIIEMERLEQPSNVSPTVSPRIENPQKQIIPDQQNILVSFSTDRPLFPFWTVHFPLDYFMQLKWPWLIYS